MQRKSRNELALYVNEFLCRTNGKVSPERTRTVTRFGIVSIIQTCLFCFIFSSKRKKMSDRDVSMPKSGALESATKNNAANIPSSSDFDSKLMPQSWVRRLCVMSLPLPVVLLTVICTAYFLRPHCCENESIDTYDSIARVMRIFGISHFERPPPPPL